MLQVSLALTIGVLLGAAIGWLLGARRAAADACLQPLVEELRTQLTARDAAAAQLQTECAAAQAAQAAAEATQQAVELAAQAHRKEQEQAVRTAAGLQENLLTAEKAKSELDAKVTYLNERLVHERAALDQAHERLRKEFEEVSNRLLVENANHFKQKSSEGLADLLNPLRENLKDFRSRLEDAYKDTAAQNAVLKDQIARVGAEAANLARALKGDVKVLGNWGEQRLDLLLEKSGLQRGVHYERQHSATDLEAEQQRYLDVIVHLPDDKHLVIDSKVSLIHYEAHLNCADEALCALHLDKHIDCLRKHVKDLAGKRYQDLYGINAPDFVIMYIPLESAFFAAVTHEPELFAYALDRNVVLITNSTLLATLRTVAHVWRLAAQQENAAEIARRGGALYDKFCGFVGDLEDLGKSIGNSQAQYDSALKKLHQGRGNLVRQAEELKSLGAKASKSLPAPLLEKAQEEEEKAELLPG